MSLKALKQYIELYHYYGISDFFIKSNKFVGRISKKPIKEEPDKNQTVDLAILQKRYSNCQKCSFAKYRMKLVYGEGRIGTDRLIIGNPPIADENILGRPFVGEYGKLFEKMMGAINMQRSDLYLTNITKCKTNYVDYAEINKCLPYLYEQISIVKPKIILVFGETPANALFQKNENIEYYRTAQGKMFDGIPIYVTYNPIELLQNVQLKKQAWVDIQSFRDAYLRIIDYDKK